MILASGDLQGQGPREGVPVHYDWFLRNNLPILYMWIPLVCLLLLPENRNRQAWIILVPVAALSLALHLLLLAMPTDSAGEDVLFHMGLAYCVGLASIGLLSGRLWGRPGGLRITGMVLALGLAIGLASVDSIQPMTHIMITTLLGVITLFTLLFARSLCKRGFRIKDFFCRFVLGTFIFGAMLSVMYMMLLSVAMGDFPPILILLTVMLIMSGIHLALAIPFLVLMLYSGFWRKRFLGMLSLSQALKP